MPNKLARYLPIGLDHKQEGSVFLLFLALAAGFSLIWFASLYDAVQNLYEWDYRTASRVLREHAIMPRFTELLGYALHGFLAIAYASLLRIAWHYSNYYRGSKSIYLMKRLPDRFELHRRCLTLPFTEAAIALLIAAGLFFLYYAVYMFVTPEPCLIPDQWMNWLP